MNDFCDAETGFDYIFTKMSAIYGATFSNHWRGIEPTIIRQTWIHECGRGLTYRPKMDFALKHMNPDRPPSALAFYRLLRDGPSIPEKPAFRISRQPTMHEKIVTEKAKQEALAKLREISQKMRVSR